MCHRCDYKDMLRRSGMEITENRLRVLEVIGSNNYPLSAREIFEILERNGHINQVTVYRILDLLVDCRLADRISTGGRAFYYGLAPNEHHLPHAHFYCTRCGHMDCLNPDSLPVDPARVERTFSGQIDKVEIRVDGICKNCLKKGDRENVAQLTSGG